METVYITDNVTVTLLHTTHETSVGSEFAVLHEVRLGWHDSVNYPLSDSSDRKHFEQSGKEQGYSERTENLPH